MVIVVIIRSWDFPVVTVETPDVTPFNLSQKMSLRRRSHSLLRLLELGKDITRASSETQHSCATETDCDRLEVAGTGWGGGEEFYFV